MAPRSSAVRRLQYLWLVPWKPYLRMPYFSWYSRDTVEVGLWFEGVVEGGVEDGDVGHAREELLASRDALEVERVVERRELGECFDFLAHLRCDDDCFSVLLCAVDDPVADRGDVLEGAQDAFFEEVVEDEGDGVLDVLDVARCLLAHLAHPVRSFVESLDDELCSFGAEPVDAPFDE